MARRIVVFLVLAMLAGCTADSSPSIVADSVAPDSLADAATVEGRSETGGCHPDCEGQQCGPNGCGESCGACPDWTICGDSGTCDPIACTTSLECPGDSICDAEAGVCVQCLTAPDCAEGETCGPDLNCHPAGLPCDSDKDCKEMGLLCNDVLGICVACLDENACLDEEYCLEGYCMPDECEASSFECEGDAVKVCADDGSGWTVQETCQAGEYCDDGDCVTLACDPDDIWCDGAVYKECSQDGMTVKYEEDCAALGLHCLQSGCIETICAPMSTFCVDDFHKGLCSADGMEYETVDCPGEHYCQVGQCLPWVCVPLGVGCEGNLAVQCDSMGSGFASQVDCGEELCMNGECVNTDCTEGSVKCSGNLLQECVDPLAGFETVTDCTVSGLSCVEAMCTAVCGDGACAESESCGNCDLDCGACVVCGECGALEKCNTEAGVCVADTVLVPEGPFWMGCSNPPVATCLGDQLPAHQVHLSSYRIDLTEVTAGQFQACVDSGACDGVSDDDCHDDDVVGTNIGKPGRETHPANCIVYGHAESYCLWVDKRLCTEAEWEKAARGGCELYADCANDSPAFPWGQGGPTCLVAQSGECWSPPGESTAPVGSFPEGQSPYGVLDLAGNVFEFVKDWYGSDYYCAGPVADVSPNDGWDTCNENDAPHDSVLNDPAGPTADSGARIVRGGGYPNEAVDLTTYRRFPKTVGDMLNLGTIAGFRCCSEP